MKIFLDTSNISDIIELKDKVDGFTTNPTLMRKAGVKDYEKWAKEVLGIIGDKPISFEVIADERGEMERQAFKIRSWGNNVYVKIPIVNTKGENTIELIKKLQRGSIKVNVTALMDLTHIINLELSDSIPSIASIFAGRIANTSEDPHRYFSIARGDLPSVVQLLWASPREVLNIRHAEQAGADIITVTPEMYRTYIKLKGKNLLEYSIETSRMFYNDAKESGYIL